MVRVGLLDASPARKSPARSAAKKSERTFSNTMTAKLHYPTKSHKGKAGRKASPLPSFLKRLRATDEERAQLAELLTGDARRDFIRILDGLQIREKFIGEGREVRDA
jgi:hypothetical protein